MSWFIVIPKEGPCQKKKKKSTNFQQKPKKSVSYQKKDGRGFRVTQPSHVYGSTVDLLPIKSHCYILDIPVAQLADVAQLAWASSNS